MVKENEIRMDMCNAYRPLKKNVRTFWLNLRPEGGRPLSLVKEVTCARMAYRQNAKRGGKESS